MSKEDEFFIKNQIMYFIFYTKNVINDLRLGIDVGGVQSFRKI